MLEVAIVGGGLCGLMLARSLHAQGQRFGLFEARNRLGGRILTAPSKVAGAPLDLGPTWYWPNTQPRCERLVKELGLTVFPQHDTGKVLNLTDHDKQPEPLEKPNLHGGAYRIEGGMTALVTGVSQGIPDHHFHLRHVLKRVIDRNDHVVLQFEHAGELLEVEARRAVLAMPPRLVEERVGFEPPLDNALCEAMRVTYTWMSDQAKVMIGYEQAFWREHGHSGNAFVQHEHTVIGEIFDACDAAGDKAALGGFLALPIELRTSLSNGMPMLVSSQMVQVFGVDAEQGDQHLHDWAAEPFTCSTLDKMPSSKRPDSGRAILRKPQWGGRLHFGGSETASYGDGYLEGALEAAARIQRSFDQAPTPSFIPTMADTHNAASLEQFAAWVSSRREEAIERYRAQLHQHLAYQLKEQITQRSVLNTMEQIYSEALSLLDRLPLSPTADLSAKVLDPFLGFNKALLDKVLSFNQSSCALSNFPDEHNISPEYLHAMASDLAAAWREFTAGVDNLLLAKPRAKRPIASAA